MEDSRNIIKAIDALTLKAGGEVVDSKNITEAIDNLKAVYSQEAIGIDDTLTQEGLAADAKAVGDAFERLSFNSTITVEDISTTESILYGISSYIYTNFYGKNTSFSGSIFVAGHDAYTVMGSVRNYVVKFFAIKTNGTAYCIADNRNNDALSFNWYTLARES